MAGHSKFKNIQHRKGAQDKKRAKIFTSLAKEIYVSAKINADPQYNPRLRAAIAAAKYKNLPKDRIEKAIVQASNKDNQENYFEVRYEGMICDGISVIIEALTNNTNRTAANVRAILNKHGAHLVETGNVSFMYDHVGIIKYLHKECDTEKLFEIAVSSGAEDVDQDEEYYIIYTPIKLFANIVESIASQYSYPVESYIGWRSRDTIPVLDIEKAQKIIKLVDAFDDDDDIERVYSNYEFSKEVYINLVS